MPALYISQSIDTTPAQVSAFASAYENLPQWAHGLSAGIRNENGHWVTDSPMGIVEVVFTGGTEFGVLDHDVILPNQVTVHNPLRVMRNGEGSEVVFTLYRQPDVNDEEYENDAAMVRADLNRLREALED